MKRILALLLLMCCMLSFASCGTTEEGDESSDSGNTNELERFSNMLSISVPSSSDVLVSQVVNDLVIESKFNLQTGVIEGKKAAVYTNTVTTLGNVEDRKLELFRNKEETVWYLEGYGTSTNKGKRWTADGKDFSPVAGSLSMDLKSKYIQSQEYKKDGSTETLVLVMTASNATKALSNFLGGNQSLYHDVTVTIVAAAERISSITISYIIPQQNLGTDAKPVWYYDIPVTIEANYSYKIDTGDIPITLD